MAARGKQRRTIEGPDVVEAQEPALEDVVALGVLAIDPPREVDEQLVEDAGEEPVVGRTVDFEDPQRGPRVYRRVDVVERPFVRGELTVGVHVPLAAEQDELPLREFGIDMRERHALKAQVPGGKPRVFPLVGHGKHAGRVEVTPSGVASREAFRGWRRLGRIAVEPPRHVVVIELLAPQHAAERLTDNQPFVGGEPVRHEARVEDVGFAATELERRRCAGSCVGFAAAEPELDHGALSGVDREDIVEGGLGANLRRIHGVRRADHVVIDAVLGKAAP